MAAFTQVVSVGLLDKFPRLKCAVLETGATWIGAWLDRMDHKALALPHFATKMLPSEYFYRQCVVSADPDETMTAVCVRHLGADYFIWASDYPHVDGALRALKEIKDHLLELPDEDQAKVLGGNAIRFYDI
jgi:predicted TIM-barrel fold metal-dependent hydrolase